MKNSKNDDGIIANLISDDERCARHDQFACSGQPALAAAIGKDSQALHRGGYPLPLLCGGLRPFLRDVVEMGVQAGLRLGEPDESHLFCSAARFKSSARLISQRAITSS
jgi:hypothetical protein